MTKAVLEQVIQRASTDSRFRDALGDNFEAAVRPYELSDDEKAQLAKGMGLRTGEATSMAASTEAQSAIAETAIAETAVAETAIAESADA